MRGRKEFLLYLKRMNNQGIMLPLLMIILLFLSSFIIVAIQSYEINYQMYEDLEERTEKQIHKIILKENDKNNNN